MGAMRPWHWIVVLLVVLVIFGGNKLPELAGSIGKSMKIFKKEVKELREDDDAPAAQIQPQQGTYYTEPTQPGQAAPVQQANPQDGAAPQA
ncbi:Sec-independent protein translocase subunit TatA [Actinomyces trachealis]|uniref:Sec-independent protein translocase subunit TatA n=1 Tax=Actinomyces trachealis TaxID=2763540 RepID=UPI001892BE46|nr:Sec-independent protein translocase subunit TatA [Actinomyces trachealis]